MTITEEVTLPGFIITRMDINLQTYLANHCLVAPSKFALMNGTLKQIIATCIIEQSKTFKAGIIALGPKTFLALEETALTLPVCFGNG